MRDLLEIRKDIDAVDHQIVDLYLRRLELAGQVAQKGYTIMPLRVYLKGSLVKIEIGLAKGKKLYDKRHDIAQKDMRREAEREMKIRIR